MQFYKNTQFFMSFLYTGRHTYFDKQKLSTLVIWIYFL